MGLFLWVALAKGFLDAPEGGDTIAFLVFPIARRGLLQAKAGLDGGTQESGVHGLLGHAAKLGKNCPKVNHVVCRRQPCADLPHNISRSASNLARPVSTFTGSFAFSLASSIRSGGNSLRNGDG